MAAEMGHQMQGNEMHADANIPSREFGKNPITVFNQRSFDQADH